MVRLMSLRTSVPVSLASLETGSREAEVDALVASYFAQQLHKVITDATTAIATDELPLARIKRIMKQDSCDPHPRMISADAVPFMAFAAQLFIGHVTMLAWKVSTSVPSATRFSSRT